jgi:hypothetical protein
MIENLLARADWKEVMDELEMIAFGSGPIAKEVGDALLKLNPNSINIYGATKMNLLQAVVTNDPGQDWQYIRFHPWTGVFIDPIGGDPNVGELVIQRNKYLAYEALQPAFENWPDADEYRSKDVFVRHPTKKDMWKWYSRTDDVITFETGESSTHPRWEELSVPIPVFYLPSFMGNEGCSQRSWLS